MRSILMYVSNLAGSCGAKFTHKTQKKSLSNKFYVRQVFLYI